MDAWRGQIETALRFFEKMRHYSVAAKKSKDVVETALLGEQIPSATATAAEYEWTSDICAK